MPTTDVAESTDSQSAYDDSVIMHHLISQEMEVKLDAQEGKESNYEKEERGWTNRTENIPVVKELLQNGPFSVDNAFESCIRLRYRYELERIGRFWAVTLDCILTPTCALPKTYDEFWSGVEHHAQRGTSVLPERSLCRPGIRLSVISKLGGFQR